MLNGVGLSLVFASALLITVADSLIKKTSISGGFFSALFSPWMLVLCALYFIQILMAIYIFMNRGSLAVYGNLYDVFYSILMVLTGIILFREQLTLLQIAGVCFAIVGGMLINGYRFGM